MFCSGKFFFRYLFYCFQWLFTFALYYTLPNGICRPAVIFFAQAVCVYNLEEIIIVNLKHEAMKKIILFAAILVSIAAAATGSPSDVSEKVLKAFNETFEKAQNVEWHEYDDYYQANFKMDDIQVRAQYDQEGVLLKTMRYYGEKQLLPNIVSKLKKKYASREVFGITEITSAEEVSFLITLKDDKNWYVVKSDVYGNLEQTEKFKRADI